MGTDDNIGRIQIRMGTDDNIGRIQIRRGTDDNIGRIQIRRGTDDNTGIIPGKERKRLTEAVLHKPCKFCNHSLQKTTTTTAQALVEKWQISDGKQESNTIDKRSFTNTSRIYRAVISLTLRHTDRPCLNASEF